jgi:HK97 gp10 family phage protein
MITARLTSNINFQQIEKEIKQKTDKVMKINAEKVKEKAKKLAPKKSGKLAGSIEVQRLAQSNYSVGSDLDYAGFVEFGTRKMRARPYLYPAFLEETRGIINELNELITG